MPCGSMVSSPHPPNRPPQSEIRGLISHSTPAQATAPRDRRYPSFNRYWVFWCVATATIIAPISSSSRFQSLMGFLMRCYDGCLIGDWTFAKRFQSLLGFLTCYNGFTNCDTNVYYISIPAGFSDVSRIYTTDSAYINVFSSFDL